MIWDFIKKRWFTIALLLILLMAIIRQNVHNGNPGTVEPPAAEQRELYIEDGIAGKNTSMLNLGSNGNTARIQLPEIEESTAIAFLQRFGRVAVTEQQKFGMPASVLLGCIYVNSFAGQRACAVQANNYLAVPCSGNWSGPTTILDGSCFRQYATAWESIRGFNLFLQEKNWLGALKKSAGQDWKAWVKGLARNNVSDVQNFEREMVKVIEAYRLFELDAIAK